MTHSWFFLRFTRTRSLSVCYTSQHARCVSGSCIRRHCIIFKSLVSGWIASPASSVAVNWPRKYVWIWMRVLLECFSSESGFCFPTAGQFCRLVYFECCWLHLLSVFVYLKPELKLYVLGILFPQLAYKHPHLNSIFCIARGRER